MEARNYDLIWSWFTRVLSFFVGLFIMSYETIADHSDRPWLYAAAIGMMGLPVAKAAEGIVSRFSNFGPQTLPPEKEEEARPPPRGGD